MLTVGSRGGRCVALCPKLGQVRSGSDTADGSLDRGGESACLSTPVWGYQPRQTFAHWLVPAAISLLCQLIVTKVNNKPNMFIKFIHILHKDK